MMNFWPMRRVEPGWRWVVIWALLAAVRLGAAETPVISPDNRVDPAAPAWRELADQFANKDDLVANFEERRVFPFRNEAVVLQGEVRVSATRGLSLHYQGSPARIIVIDSAGMLVRNADGQKGPPLDPRANAANEVMRSILRLDFATLASGYEMFGAHHGENWSLRLVPRDAGTRRAIGEIFVEGTGTFVRRIELRRSARQHITIAMSDPRAVTFSEDEVKRYFR
jgi:hypothetical protein